MKTSTGLLLAVAAAALPSVQAQTVADPTSAAASATIAPKAGPRRLTPLELRDSGTTPGDRRPEDRVTTQIVVPLNKGAAKTKVPMGAPARRAASAGAGIDDSAARCEAESSRPAREKCLAARAAAAGAR